MLLMQKKPRFFSTIWRNSCEGTSLSNTKFSHQIKFFETALTVVQKKCPKMYAEKGAKNVGTEISGEKGRTITGVFAVIASGVYVPPMLIYPHQRMRPTLGKNGPPGAKYCCSKNGRINTELFVERLSHFKKFLKPTEADPVLLICDNHTSHISLQAYEFCCANFIHMVSIRPNTSHKLQVVGNFQRELLVDEECVTENNQESAEHPRPSTCLLYTSRCV